MRTATWVSLFVLVFIGGRVVNGANDEIDSSEDGEQLSEDTNLVTIQSNATETNANSTSGDSRTGLGGRIKTEVPSYVSILWCPKVKHKQDGHLCGIALWLTEQHFVCSNNAAYEIKEQLGNKWDGPPAGWKMSPRPVIDINNEPAGDPDTEDWRFRWFWSKTLMHDLGIWRTISHDYHSGHVDKGLKNTWPHDPQFRDHLESPLDFTPYLASGLKGMNCHVLVYSSKDPTETVRKFSRIDVELDSCENAKCLFGWRSSKRLLSTNNTNVGKGGQLLGRWSDIGAPVFCGKLITHIVTQTTPVRFQFYALEVWRFKPELTLERKITEIASLAK